MRQASTDWGPTMIHTETGTMFWNMVGTISVSATLGGFFEQI